MPVPDSVAVWRSNYVNIDLQTISQSDKNSVNYQKMLVICLANHRVMKSWSC